jgi:hypothetical protein
MKAVKIFLENLIFAFRYQRIWLKIVPFDTRGLLWNVLLPRTKKASTHVVLV